LTYKLPNKSRIVAIGDIHGDLLVLLAVLYMMGVIDLNGNWIGGSTIVVQCGDLLDRSGRPNLSISTTPNFREEVDIMQYLHALDRQARKSGGGRVLSLLGNHEASNIYMTNEYSMYMLYQDSNQVSGWGGLRNKQRLFRPGGMMAKWMSNHTPIILQVGKFLFVHGGYKEQQQQQQSASQIAQQTSKALRDGNELSEIAKFILTDRSGSCPLDSKWDGLVIGHTVASEVKGTCQNRVWYVDVAMSEAFGEPSTLGALEIFKDHRIRTLNYARGNLLMHETTTKKL
jgi:hypothetical protein